ncbi:MAG: tetratricopeptide repeat protein [Patescibacteria group bacterium]
MRKHLLGLAIALAVLIVSISVWIVVSSFQKTGAPADTAIPPVATTSVNNDTTVAPTTTKTAGTTTAIAAPVARGKNFTEHMRFGAEFLALENYEQAASEFAAAVTLEPSAIGPLLNLAEAEVQLQDFEKARANLLAAEQLDANNPDISILRGIIFLRENNFLEAERAFSQAGDKAGFWSGAMAAFFDRRDEAVKLLQATTDARAPEILAAFDEYSKYTDSPKTHLDALLTRAFVAIGEYQLALAKIGPVLEDDANYRDAWILTGYAQFAEQKFELARESWQTAYALDSGKPETQYFLGLVSFELKNWDDAEKFFLLARGNHFEPDDLDEKLIEIYLTSGKYRAAADLLSEKINADESASIDDFTRAISLYLEKLNDGQKAWAVASLAVTRLPESSPAWNLAGWVSLKNNQLAKARTQLEHAIQLDPKSPWPYYNLGQVFEKSGKTAAALTAYHDAFELDSNGPAGVLAARNYNRLLSATNPDKSTANPPTDAEQQ